MPPKKKLARSRSNNSLDDYSDTSTSRRVNGVNDLPSHSNSKNLKRQVSDSNANAPKIAASKLASDVEEPPKKQNAKVIDADQKRKGCKSNDASPNRKKKKHKSQAGDVLSRSSYGDTDDGSSSEEDDENSTIEYSHLPAIGDEIAIKCPAEPPFPEGWYAAVVLDVIQHGHACSNTNQNSSTKSNGKSNQGINFTLQVEWDGGGVEKVENPNWRKKGDEPDRHGRRSHRDAKLRPYFRYWVHRLNSMSEAEKKLQRCRAGKYSRVDPNQKVEWIQCSNPSCGKWRPLPLYLKSSSVLESCNNTWYCVLNSWDEATASCGAPQESGYMPPPENNP